MMFHMLDLAVLFLSFLLTFLGLHLFMRNLKSDKVYRRLARHSPHAKAPGWPPGPKKSIFGSKRAILGDQC